METEVDRIPIAGLEIQYGIPRSVLHDRMNALSIKRTKIGNKSYIDSKALELLNGLDAHMKAKLPMALFLERVGKRAEAQIVGALEPRSQSSNQTDVSDLAVAAQSGGQMTIASPVVIQVQSQTDIQVQAEKRRILREAAEHNEVLPTSELLPLLGLRSLPKHNGTFSRRGFTFSRVEPKVGREVEWRVAKL